MIANLKEYITSFLNRSGSYVLVATVVARLLSFIASWIALQLINNEKLGVVLYAWNIIAFLIPLVGLGLHQSLLRYGALLTDENERKSLLHYVVKNGTFVSIFMSVFVSIIALLYPFTFENTGIYVAIFSISLIPHFLVETIKTQLRLTHNNKGYAIVDVTFSFILVITVFAFSYFYKENGYVAALLLTPALCAILFFNKVKTNKKQVEKLTVTDKEFWKYGVYGGLSNVTIILLFAIDILLIGNILDDANAVTAFRYISIIPFSILFLPRAFITTDFVSFTERIYDTNYIKNYIKNYLLLFGLVSVLYLLFFYVFADETLSIFDSSFTKHKDSFFILNIGVCGILFLRGLYSNLLSSIGLVKITYYITLLAIILNIICNYYLIPKLGIKGAAITSASLMWLTGIGTCVAFYFYYKKLLLKNRSNVK